MSHSPPNRNPILEILNHQPVMILDGGLATAMEARGCDLNDELWSAKVLLEDPELIRGVHLDYLHAGADCIATASYQATLPGFGKRGLSHAEGVELLELSVRLAREARDMFWADTENRKGRLRPLVAGSIGPYGAYLADGSEYSGHYAISDAELYEFHRERWHVLSRSGPDIMACETIPSLREAGVLMQLARETPDLSIWLSFSCMDEAHVSDGGRLLEAAMICDKEPLVAAVGVNCVPPEMVLSLISELRKGTNKPVLVYPNLGEEYDPADKVWRSSPSSLSCGKVVPEWVQGGAAGVGGCCRVGPGRIAEIRRWLLG